MTYETELLYNVYIMQWRVIKYQSTQQTKHVIKEPFNIIQKKTYILTDPVQNWQIGICLSHLGFPSSSIDTVVCQG